MKDFEEIRNRYPDLDPCFPDFWEDPIEDEIKAIESEYGIKYSDQFVQFQLIECKKTPMGDRAFDDFGWANPSMSPFTNLREKVKDAQEIGTPKNLAPFKHDNGDFYCITEEGKIVIWDHNSNSIEPDKRYQWDSFCDWLASTIEA